MLKEWLDTIQCIDCLEGLKKLPNNSIDLIIADPPYGISRELNCKNQRLGSTAKLNFNFGEWDKFNKEWFEIAIKKTKGWIITFCAKKDIGVYWNILEKSGFVAIDSLAWIKPDPLPLNAKSRFLNAWESIVVAKKPGAYWGSKYFPNIFKFQAPKGKDRVHPTQKPLKLMEELIELTTEKNAIVLDPFIGSGTTAVACKQLGRHFIGFEISKEFCELAKKRLSNVCERLRLEIFQ
jgi:site-specific DNA-methyltransferase (adenine-specific)